MADHLFASASWEKGPMINKKWPWGKKPKQCDRTDGPCVGLGQAGIHIFGTNTRLRFRSWYSNCNKLYWDIIN